MHYFLMRLHLMLFSECFTVVVSCEESYSTHLVMSSCAFSGTVVWL
jgi:hypothetical protein